MRPFAVDKIGNGVFKAKGFLTHAIECNFFLMAWDVFWVPKKAMVFFWPTRCCHWSHLKDTWNNFLSHAKHEIKS